MTDRPFIDGDWCTPATELQAEAINPASGEVAANIVVAGVTEAKQAVSAARKAFCTWSATTGDERGSYLDRIAGILERDKEQMSKLSTEINGKPVHESSIDLEDAISCYRYYAQKARELDGQQEQDVPLGLQGCKSYVRFEPAGVVALIVPWNFPLVTSAWKIAPALAAGCTAVLKPADPTSLIELQLGRIVDEAGLPPGVLNIVPGIGAEVGEYLTSHPGIDKISFTGSNMVGSKVMESAARRSTNVSLELGGKSPIIVFDDADMDQAVEAVIAGIFYNCGQMCSATSRLLVQAGISDAFLARLEDAISEITVGPGDCPETTMGPMTSNAQLNRVLDYFEIAREEGLIPVTGGARDESFQGGFYVSPTVYWNVPPTSRLWREEIFGPVLCACTFDTEEQAIVLANDSDFGLAATVVSQDEETLRRVSKRLLAGHIWWNMPQFVAVETSWGGFKQSGIGRELGPWGLSAFLEVKHINYHAG